MEQQFNDRLDILKHVSDIKLRLKNDITNDFVLARLDPKDKLFIIEMTGNAYFSKKLLDILANEGMCWNFKDGKYEKKSITKEEKNKIKAISKSVFDSYMIKIYMTVILNRNVDKNYLINVLSGYNEEPEERTLNLDERSKGAISELLADNSKKEK